MLADVAAAGFGSPPEVDVLEARSRAASADVAAAAFCCGTPLRAEIEAREPAGLDDVVAACTAALERRFGSIDLDAKIRGFVVTTTPHTPFRSREGR